MFVQMTSQVDTVDTALGNTVPSASSKKQQARSWVFTMHEPKVDTVDTLCETLKGVAKKFVFQLEKAPTTGREHYQGWIMFKNAKTMGGVIKVLEGFGKPPHVEVARGDEDANIRYCTKPETKAGGPWTWGITPMLRDPLAGVTLYTWQRKAIEEYNKEPDERTIRWFWDATGNCGKTALAKHLCMNKDTIYVNGKAADVKCAVAKLYADGKPPRCVIFGIPRTVTAEYVSYSALEEIKDGIFFSGKYESGMVTMNPPHVWVFANFAPDEEKLSKDRWSITYVDRKREGDPASGSSSAGAPSPSRKLKLTFNAKSACLSCGDTDCTCANDGFGY